MADEMTNRSILQRMLRHIRRMPHLAAQPQPTTCGSGFGVTDFAVTYPNGELIATAAVTAVPPDTTLLGVTVAASPDPSSPATYCMGVASEPSGLSLPVSVLGASTSPVISGPTRVTGTVVLCYQQGGTMQECVVTQQFTVGG